FLFSFSSFRQLRAQKGVRLDEPYSSLGPGSYSTQGLHCLVHIMDPVGKVMDLLAAWRQHRIATAAVGATAVYLVVARALRNRRRDNIVRSFGYPGRSLSSMTVDEAYEIRKQVANLEFPETIQTSLFFALFKVRFTRPLDDGK